MALAAANVFGPQVRLSINAGCGSWQSDLVFGDPPAFLFGTSLSRFKTFGVRGVAKTNLSHWNPVNFNVLFIFVFGSETNFDDLRCLGERLEI